MSLNFLLSRINIASYNLYCCSGLFFMLKMLFKHQVNLCCSLIFKCKTHKKLTGNHNCKKVEGLPMWSSR